MLNKDAVREIRMMLERRWTTKEIAHKMCVRELEVEQALKTL